jgi:ADP-ribose pyrophosphatase
MVSKVTVFQRAIFKIEEVKYRQRRYDGSESGVITRLNLDRGDSVAALLHDPAADSVILVEQFRVSTYDNGDGWLLELPAGIVELKRDATAEVTMRRELIEEVGYHLDALQHILTFYLSPGGSSERIFLYYGQISPESQISAGGGRRAEGEDIRTLALPVESALAKLDAGEIVDAKTIVALQWLRLRRTHAS